MVYWDRKHEIAVKELDAISWSAKKAGVSYGTKKSKKTDTTGEPDI